MSTTVDAIVLEGMGLPTAGFDSRSELPTDPTAHCGTSVGRTSAVTRIPDNEVHLLRRIAARLLCAQEVRQWAPTQASPTTTQP